MALIFEQKDNQIFDELKDIVAAAAVTKGEPAVVRDVFGFYHNAVTAEDLTNNRDDVTFIYRCRQVEAVKVTGTGEAIQAGDRVYYIVASEAVSATATGTPGTNSYFCGWAKENATATASTVLINFDGTRYDETL